MDGRSGFKNLIPILKNEDLLPLLYKLNNQFSLEKFLKDQKIYLSIEEIEKLWDIIEVCKSSSGKDERADKISCAEERLSDESYKVRVSESDLNISGGKDKFYSNISKMADILE